MNCQKAALVSLQIGGACSKVFSLLCEILLPQIYFLMLSFTFLIFNLLCPTGGEESQVEFEFDASMSVLTLRKPGMNAGVDWTVTLQ